jgi:small-conductance mechanosensitive channel
MAAKHDNKNEVQGGFFARPVVGTILTVLSGLSFLLLLMCLPLVGPAGDAVSYREANFMTFLLVLLISLALAVLAVVSKMARRKLDHSPLPIASFGLVTICLVLLITLFAGLLKI